MHYYQSYNYPQIIQFAFLIITQVSYCFILLICFQSKLFQLFAVRLFILLCLSQLMIFIPLMVTPYFTNPYGDPSNRITFIGKTNCIISGSSIVVGWISATLLSLYMEYNVYQALNGKIVRKNGKDECLAYLIIYSLAIISNPFQRLLNIIFKCDIIVYGQKNYKSPQYSFCTLEDSNMLTGILLGIDILSLIISIILYLLINQQKNKLKIMGFSTNSPLQNIPIFPITTLTLFTFNMIIKMADNFVLFKGTDNIFLNFIWQIMNSIYPLEGIFFLMIFIHNFLPFFEKKLSPKFIQFLKTLNKIQSFFKQKKNLDDLKIDQKVLGKKENFIESDNLLSNTASSVII